MLIRVQINPKKFCQPLSVCVFDTFPNKSKENILLIINIFYIQGSSNAAFGEIAPDARRPHT